MMTWYEDIRSLIEKTGEEKLAFVKKHVRNTSGPSMAATSLMTTEAPDDEYGQASLPSAGGTHDALAEPTPVPRTYSGGSFLNDHYDNRNGPQPPIPRSATSSVYGQPDHYSVDARPMIGARPVDGPHQDYERHASGDYLSPAAPRYSSASESRSAISMQQIPPVPEMRPEGSHRGTPLRSSLGVTTQDVSPKSFAPDQDAQARYSDASSRQSSTAQYTQRPAGLVLDVSTNRLGGSSLRQEVRRDSGGYSPTSTSRDTRLLSTTHNGELRSSADYSPTSMPKMALDFNDAPTVTQPASAYGHYDAGVERQEYSYELSPPMQAVAAESRLEPADYVGPTRSEFAADVPPHSYDDHQVASDNRPAYAAHLAATDSILANNGRDKLEGFHQEDNFTTHPQARFRPASSIYENDSLLTAHQLAEGGMPSASTNGVLVITPQTDDGMTTMTEDRDEMTTTTEARTSVDTTIPINDLQDSDGQLMSEKDMDMMNAGEVKSGRWDGTVRMSDGVWPVLRHADTVTTVGDLYVPGKYVGMKSAFSEHFDD